MFRGILFGTIAFGTIFLLERQLGTVFQDMRRYDKLRAMSGDSSLLVEGLKAAGSYLMRDNPPGAKGGEDGAAGGRAQSGNNGSLFSTLRKDALRYAALRAM